MEQREFSPLPASRARKFERLLLLLFLFSLPFLNPWIRGDGVGYYAFARALLIEHNLDFAKDYQAANASFRDNRLRQVRALARQEGSRHRFARAPHWHGMASFGNRFFISLTPILVFGLALFLQRFGGLFRSPRRVFVSAAALLLLFVLWNVGLIFQCRT